MDILKEKVGECKVCEPELALGARPVFTASRSSKIVVIGQAPGRKVHESGLAWDDKSGDNLRSWMGIDKKVFYDESQVALIPMGFCYPGTGKSGDLPPRKECAPLWHKLLLDNLEAVELVVLIGQYAQNYYLEKSKRATLTETVKNYGEYLPKYFVLPHPSPRNNIWQAKNSWFAEEVLPQFKKIVSEIL